MKDDKPGCLYVDELYMYICKYRTGCACVCVCVWKGGESCRTEYINNASICLIIAI